MHVAAGLKLLTLAALVYVLAGQLLATARDYQSLLRNYQSNPRALLDSSDFLAFYMGGKLMLSSDRGRSYDEEAQARAILPLKGHGEDLSQDSGWYRYYNPPAYSLVLAPLTLLEPDRAYLVTVALNLIAFGGLVWLVGTVLRWRQPITLLVILGIAASEPLYYAFWHAQPNILLALIVGSAFLLAEHGGRSAGAVLALAAIKPQWLAFPALALLRARPKAALGLAGVLSLMLIPFLLIGAEGTLDYIRLVRARGSGDVGDDGFTEALLSWSGFFRAYSGAAKPEAWLAFSILTALAFLPVWRSRNRDLLPLGAVLSTLLIGPHSHPQDWIIIAPAAGFLLRNQGGLRLWVSASLLLAILAGLGAWHGLSQSEKAVYWPTPAAFALLLWLSVLSLHLDRRLVLAARTLAPRTILRAGRSMPPQHTA